MKLEQASYSVDSVIQLKESVHEYLIENEETKAISSDSILGGVLSSVRYSWLACGPRLEVLDTKSGCKVAAWVFRAAHEFDIAVTCVAELPAHKGNTPLLLVGLGCEITGGMICVFDVGSSRVIRAVQIDEKVTSVEVVCGGCDSGLPGVFRALDGVVAVGTAKGKVLLVDLCRQICEDGITNSGFETLRDEINPCHLIQLGLDDLRNLENHKEMSLNRGDHLCLQLNEKSTTGPHFSLFGPTGDLRLRANLSEVAISSLHFSPSLGSLLVGYNFGCWSLYNLLSGPVLDYTSPMYEDCLPVSGFSVQEPCDDPRAFLYVWVAYSSIQVEEASMVVMYALTYDSKDCLEGYGCLYQDLGSCSVRFQIELAKLAQTKTARCLNLRSYNRQVNMESPEERLTVCCIVWSSFDSSTNSLDTYLSVFDLNQWYKEQMPSEPHLNFNHYMSCVNITQLLSLNGTNFDILDLRLDPNSLSPFTCPLRLEEHYQPSALALRGFALGPKQATWLSSPGAQRHLLQQLEIAGPLSLMQPQELYLRALSLGLCPQYQDVVVGPSVKQMRWHILSVALEHQLVRWLCRCAKEWSTGAQSISGCTLDFLLEWALHRASILKSNSDKLCVPLFDHTGDILDHNSLLQLNHAACQLKHLATLFETVVQVCKVCFAHQDLEDITYQYTSLQMLTTYLEVLQWLLNVGLLPERPLSMYPNLDSAILSAPYPVETLSKFYKSRRSDLSEPLLFIDQLISRELGGDNLIEQWRSDGGDGNYPPPSLQSLLRTYLLENVDLVHKHCLFIYVFLDLAMILDEGRYKTTVTHLIKFPAVFKISAGVIKATQAMWQLDHGDFSTAMAQLLDPAVGSEDLKGWQHRLILKALLLQGQHQHALLYHQVRKPPVSTVQDICIIITLLIVNDLLQESFHFQRQNRSVYNEKEILKHFFSVCDKMNQLQTILQLPLSPSEESAFISYLQQHSSDLNDHLQIIYYLQRDRYEEAFFMNDKLNAKGEVEPKQGLLGQQGRNLRNVVVQGFKKTLPSVSQKLLDVVRKEKERKSCWKQVERPIPMSVFIHDSKDNAKYKSTLIQASFQKAKETWTWLKDKEYETPFISTPKTPVREKRNEPVLIYASAMHPEIHSEDADYESTPAKRIKLSPRQPISAQLRVPRLSTDQSPHNLSLLDTPIVKRKSYRTQNSENNYTPVGTPTSILKVRSLIKRSSRSPDVDNGDLKDLKDVRGTSTTPEVLDEDMEESETVAVKPVLNISTSILTSRRRSSLGVSPRRPIQRTPRPAVHFEDVDRPSSRSSDGSITEVTNTNLEVQCEVHREQTPDLSSKDSSKSTDDVFYSPDESLEQNEEEKMDVENMEVEEIETERKNLKRKLSDTSVKSRRSYKTVTPVKVQVEKPTTNEEKTSVLSSPRRSLRSKSKEPQETVPKETSPRKEIFPKLGGRRSLSRQVLEQNTIRALQQPLQTRLSLAKVENETLKQVEVSYSKTVTSIVKTSSNNSTEETCDKSVVEMTNTYTTEKDSSENQIIKHEHTESSTKSSVRKLTEVFDDQKEEKSSQELSFVSASEGTNRILSSSSDVEESFLQKSNQNWESEKSFWSSPTTSERELPKIEEKRNKPVDKIMEEVYKKLEEAKSKKILNETRFSDISSIVQTDDEVEMEVEENVLEPEENVLEQEKNVLEQEEKVLEQEENVLVQEEKVLEQEENVLELEEEETRDSVYSEETEKRVSLEREEILEEFQSEESNQENQNAESRTSSQISNQSESSKNKMEHSSEEENKNILVPSSEEETDDEEKLSNQDEEQPLYEEIEEEELEDFNEEQSPEEEEESENSSRSSDVIEIKSSSEESMEELRLNKSTESVPEDEDSQQNEEMENIVIEEIQVENVEEIQSNEDENNEIQEENVLEQNEDKEQNIDVETKQNVLEEHSVNLQQEQNVEIEKNIETEQEQNEEKLEVNVEITEHIPEQNVEVLEKMEVEENVELQMEEKDDDIDIPEDIQLEIDESMSEEQDNQEQQQPEPEPVEEKKSSPVVEPKQTYSSASQDCLETMNFTQPPQAEIFNQTDILCGENLAQMPDQIFQEEEKIEEYVPENISLGSNQVEESYTPSRRSKRISSKQDPKNEEIIPSGIQARRRSINVEENKDLLNSPARNTRRRSASVDVDVKKIEEKPIRSTRRAASVDIEIKDPPKVSSRSRKISEASEELKKPARITRTRSASVDVEPIETKTSKTQTSEASEEIKKPARITRTRSASVDVEPIETRTSKTQTSTEASEELKKPARITRTRSASVDVEDVVSSLRTRRRSIDIEAKEEIKPASRTRTRSTSIDEEKPTARKTRSASVEEEETVKRSTRASSVTSLPAIEEEQPKITSSPGRRGRKRSIQAETIPEEPEEPSEEMKKALEHIPEKIEEYSNTHRLTRRQKQIMEKSLEQQELKKIESKHTPVKLKKPEPHTPEEDLHSASPSSSVSSSPSRRGRRPSSTTPTSSRRSARTTRTPSRDTQDDVSSVRSVPVIKLDKSEIERHRSLSPTALDSPKSKKYSRKSILPKTDLTKISEENSTPETQRKRGRPKKTQEPQSSQSLGDSESKPRQSTYRPLETYGPRVSAIKMRKSFKVKKINR